MAIPLTTHAIQRLSQRGISSSDLDLIMEIGSEVHDGYLVRAKDVQSIERKVKRFLDRIRRLRGKRIVLADGSLVTAYHAESREERKLLRHKPIGRAKVRRRAGH